MLRAACSVYDTASMTFGQPFFAPAIGAALRGFSDEVNRSAPAEQNPLFHHPEDFQLWLLAWYDDSSGEFQPDESGKRMLARGQDVKAEK